jgi:flap endonuclease-1
MLILTLNMGIQDLTKTIKKHAPLAIEVLEPARLPGTTYGVDVFSYLYPAKYNPSAKGKGQHIRFFFDLICTWHQAGKRLIMVFDGNTSAVEAKADTVQKRADARQKTRDIIQEAQTAIQEGHATLQDHVELERAMRNNIKINVSDTDDLKTLFTYMRVPYYQAVGEADSLLASLHSAGMVTGVISEDSDILTHGVKLVVRGLIDAANRSAGIVNLYKLDMVLSGLNMTMTQFIDFCIMSGCDYCPRIPGVGPVTALKHISNGGTPLTCSQAGDTYKDKYLVACRMFTEHEDVPSAGEVMGSASSSGTIEASGAPDQLEASEFKSWILENTNFMEKTLTEKIALLQQAPVPVEKPKIKLTAKPKIKLT